MRPEPDLDGDVARDPSRWESDVVLIDGGAAHVRPVRAEDADRIRAFHERQSGESIYFRYFTPMPTLSDRELQRLIGEGDHTRMAFVALVGDDIIGMASYDLWRGRNEAEAAFIVDDAHQGRGLATVLLEWLVVAAREAGLDALTATVLPGNRRMLSVFHQAGFDVSSHFEDGVIEVRLGLEPTERSAATIELRERLAEARSVERLLFPGSVAVIGAGRERGGLGHEVFRNLVAHGFNGTVFPVNPQGGQVASVRSYPTVADVPDRVDLAVIAVPAAAVLDVIEECARKRVHALVIISAGFDGLTVDGRPAEGVIAERVLRSGMRVIGPESLGLINTAPDARLHATFADVTVGEGSVGFLTQSGTLGIAALDHATRLGLGISTFVDIGNRVDVSGNDLLQFWREDPRTSVVLLYLESFGNPRKFTRIVRAMARSKPVVAVKSGRQGPEREGAGPGPAWPADATVGALLSQSGAIRVDTPTELFDVARVLVSQPVPAGRRVAVVSNAKGATLLTVDACAGAGLEVALPTGATRAALAALSPHPDGRPRAGVRPDGPVQLTWGAGPADYEHALRATLADDGVDAALVVYAPPAREQRRAVARALRSAQADHPTKPVLATFLGAPAGEAVDHEAGAVPLFAFPSEAARVLGQIVPYGEWLAEPPGTVPTFDDLDATAVRATIAEVLATDPAGAWLDRGASAALLRHAGLHVAHHREVRGVDEALAAAEEIGWPVVLKAAGVVRYHRGEVGGVALDLHDAGALAAAHARMADALGDAMDVAIVQELVPLGVEVLVGVHQNPSYGGVMTMGIGGAMAPANPDLPVRVLPLTDTDAHRLVAASPVASLLGAGVDAPAARSCEEALLRLGALADQVPEISEVLLNPLIVSGGAAWVVDAWVRVEPYEWDPAPAVRRLS